LRKGQCAGMTSLRFVQKDRFAVLPMRAGVHDPFDLGAA
jgi:hypothetical protein